MSRKISGHTFITSNFRTPKMTNYRAVSITFIAVVACSVSGYIAYNIWKSKRPPKKWKKVGQVKNLYVYPLKSGRYIETDKVVCKQFGFCLPEQNGMLQLKDRCFIVYGETDLVGTSARIFPRMILITVSSRDDKSVIFSAPEMDDLIIVIPDKSVVRQRFIKFQNTNPELVPTLDCGDEAAKWLSTYIRQKDSGLRLGYNDDVSAYRSIRLQKETGALKYYKHITSKILGIYSDLAAVLLLNEKSLHDLNQRLDKTITKTHFRPNLVVDGLDLEPFDEDGWLWLKIGNVMAKSVKDCTRCIMTTVDPETGLRNPDREPLKTLVKYRVCKGPTKAPIMGVNLEIVEPGDISVEDDVYIGMDD